MIVADFTQIVLSSPSSFIVSISFGKSNKIIYLLHLISTITPHQKATDIYFANPQYFLPIFFGENTFKRSTSLVQGHQEPTVGLQEKACRIMDIENRHIWNIKEKAY